MNKRQHETEKAKLKDERKVLEALKEQYKQAAEDVQGKIHIHNNKIDFILNEYDKLDDDMKSILQSQIYQQKFQKQIKAQIDTIIEKMNDNQYDTIQEYLDDCYVTSFVGTAYDLHGQGIPLVLPIDQKSMVDAVTLDPKLSAKLYGTYMEQMKVNVAAEISRGIAMAETFDHIARNISNRTNQSFNNTMRIVRTEGHGVQIRAAVNMQERAKKAGADVLKQWDATLDARTRDSHARLDGEIRELDERFSNGMKYPSDPAGGASEVINCRCALLQRARWALDDEELEELKQRAEYYGLDKTDNFNDFKKKYLNATEASGKMSDEEMNEYLIRLQNEKNEWLKKENYDIYGDTLDEMEKGFWEEAEDGSMPEASAFMSSINKKIDDAFQKLGYKNIVDNGQKSYTKTIKGGHSIADDIKSTNPSYNPKDYKWSQNCQRCVPAYEMRRRGFDVVAKPRKKGNDSVASSWRDIFENAVWEKCGTSRKESTKQSIIDNMLNYGDGSRAEIYIVWKGGRSSHVFVAENDNGTVKFIDPQTGNMDVSYYFDHIMSTKTEMCRIDNLKTTDLIRGCCE